LNKSNMNPAKLRTIQAVADHESIPFMRRRNIASKPVTNDEAAKPRSTDEDFWNVPNIIMNIATRMRFQNIPDVAVEA